MKDNALLSKLDIERYQEMGYLVIKGGLRDSAKLCGLVDEVNRFGKLFSERFSIHDAGWLADVGSKERSTLYRGLRYLPALTQLACSPSLLQLAQVLGIWFPGVMHSYNLRMDRPGDNDSLFHWHQDITYLLGSHNSVTFWLPLTAANKIAGSINVVPGSHRSGLAPFRPTHEGVKHKNASLSPKDIELHEIPSGDHETIEADYGDIVVFSQWLLHRSAPNLSEQVRWTVQVRMADMAEPGFRQAGYPMGDSTTILKTDYYLMNTGGQSE